VNLRALESLWHTNFSHEHTTPHRIQEEKKQKMKKIKKLFCFLFKAIKWIFIVVVAMIFLQSCTNINPRGDLIYAEANAENGFNFPYFLFIPDDMNPDEKLVLIVEPNNSGFADDDLQKHID
jgi:hypothetical protein